ncbi:septum formation protein [Williamsia limnetica]|uniref:Nucleoside triphosphate pyrophosphatase n=1 Tax=Williamsia limnetica TaxID=882452 RepID=A0A318RKY0_WILLI|nr:nucleoside triphosphate pyrophosphatase [Williamsia limnetica]PYE14739.1 septum formation protein [Williamsia limnetica]
MTRFILASASPARLRILQAAGLDPAVHVSDVDEDALIAEIGSHATPAEIVVALAQAKAESVVAGLDQGLRDDTVLVGCDSMLHHAGALTGKPHTPAAARAQWHAMRGTEAELLTGHCLMRLKAGHVVASESRTVTTTIRFSTPTDSQIDAYVATGEPLAVAGAFTLDGLGGWFVDGIDGDPSSVIGISLPLVRSLLDDVGVSITDLWK